MLALTGGTIHFHPPSNLAHPRSRFLVTALSRVLDFHLGTFLTSVHFHPTSSLPKTQIPRPETYTTPKSRNQILDEVESNYERLVHNLGIKLPR